MDKINPDSNSPPPVSDERPGGRTRPVTLLPEPAHFWAAGAPRSWRFRSKPWTDIARSVLGGKSKPSQDKGFPDFEIREIDDLFYLPPVDKAMVKERDALAKKLIGNGIPVLLQLAPGEKTRVKDSKGLLHVLYDLFEPLAAGNVDALAKLPEGAIAVWPMIPGVTDEVELWDDGFEVLGLRKVRCVQPLIVELTPTQRRRLAEGRDEQVFDALFHGRLDGRIERAFSVQAHGQGLGLYVERPRTGNSSRVRANREIAAQLSLAGDLWLRVEDSTSAGHGMLRGARGAESTQHDLTALAREGNLKVIDWLTAAAQELIEEWVGKGHSTLVAELTDRYLRIPPKTPPEE